MRRKHGFYGAPSALALALALGGAPAFGQDAAQSGDAEQLGAPAGADAIVVTGTRITSGFTAPTPVTVQTADELLTSAPGTLADGLNQLPQFRGSDVPQAGGVSARSEEHTSELQSLMRISYAVFCLKKKKTTSTPQV